MNPGMEREPFHYNIPLAAQARLTLVDVFHESVAYRRFYQRPFDMLGVALRGRGEDSVSTNMRTGEVMTARENDIRLIPCGLPQMYHHTLGAERYGIHFRLELFPGLDVFAGIDSAICENSPALREEAEDIFAEKDRVLLLSRCTEFALRFCHRHWPDHYNFDLEKARRFEDLLRELQSVLSARTRVEWMARRAHLSQEAFSRTFREIFRQSPKEYLQQELYRRAAALLLDPCESVKSVAAKLDFANEFYFSRFFKKMSGAAPAVYMKANSFRKSLMS
ncbi:MAG: helix-turn-helix transcriptional regulator [Lentisphaeria bacterium]|nr:helix-turn-helix transcriptional regulator [Lentisphaeria bacterium]